jgi:phage virion morphogenesis protein
MIINDTDFLRHINEKRARANNLTLPMKYVAQEMQSAKDMNFRKEQDPNGRKWALLSVTTLMARRNDYDAYMSKILADTGRLKGSFGTKYAAKSASIGTNLKYAATHQFGRVTRGIYKSGRRRGQSYSWSIPARPMIGINARQRAKYKRWITNYIENGVIS